MDSPQTLQQLVWWGFNALWLVVIALHASYQKSIRDEIRAMRGDIRTEQRYNKWVINIVMMLRTRCSMMHPNTPMPDMPGPPEEVDP